MFKKSGSIRFFIIRFLKEYDCESHYFLCVPVSWLRSMCVSERETERGGEGVQTGVLREDTRGRVSARLCRLALTATDAGLK